MAAETTSGEFYVKDTRIDCDLCRQAAPHLFARKFTGTGPATYLYAQPHNPMEMRMHKDPLEACPVEAIGYKLF